MYLYYNFICKLTNTFFEATVGIIVANISDHLSIFYVSEMSKLIILYQNIGILYRILMTTKTHRGSRGMSAYS